ncbi:MAG: hypothetical protein WBN08_13485 [Thiogranum sp.]
MRFRLYRLQASRIATPEDMRNFRPQPAAGNGVVEASHAANRFLTR